MWTKKIAKQKFALCKNLAYSQSVYAKNARISVRLVTFVPSLPKGMSSFQQIQKCQEGAFDRDTEANTFLAISTSVVRGLVRGSLESRSRVWCPPTTPLDALVVGLGAGLLDAASLQVLAALYARVALGGFEDVQRAVHDVEGDYELPLGVHLALHRVRRVVQKHRLKPQHLPPPQARDVLWGSKNEPRPGGCDSVRMTCWTFQSFGCPAGGTVDTRERLMLNEVRQQRLRSGESDGHGGIKHIVFLGLAASLCWLKCKLNSVVNLSFYLALQSSARRRQQMPPDE